MNRFICWLKEQVNATGRGCFVYRPVLNAKLLAKWARSQNVGGDYSLPEDMHVTVMHSTANIRNHKAFKLATDTMLIDPVQYASVLQNMGPDGAVVLKFDSGPLFNRWRDLISYGAIWTFPTYYPHVTLSYKTPESGWWKTIIPTPTFALHLGPEEAEDLKP